MISIEKNVPIPKKASGKQAKYPFRSMQIGDSFLCDQNKSQRTIGSNASIAGKRLGMVFTTRVMEDGFIRVWRIE